MQNQIQEMEMPSVSTPTNNAGAPDSVTETSVDSSPNPIDTQLNKLESIINDNKSYLPEKLAQIGELIGQLGYSGNKTPEQAQRLDDLIRQNEINMASTGAAGIIV